ncbi:hypothetical protein A5707_09150 [Mycobacterium kyorinense]|uniref:Uncharacterized protein n=1 Tax=Mycobacterium kyorinense TaxID=487514 RepID=A0A1A2YT01_9MYCO|nr:hypothetical protein [Mycobacterium kyorinense]OBI40573.1 hypothetical protein A5707_09150 [Mycobacterium kyorinense]
MTSPLPNPSRITEWAEISRRFINQASAVVLEANEQIKAESFGGAQWTKSARRLVNLALTAGLEMAPQSVCFPQSAADLELSDFIDVDPDNECERVLSVAKPFVLDGAPSCVIPNQFVVFVPAILRVYAKRFRVGVSWPDLRSGTYRGRVRLARTQTPQPGSQEIDVVIDL